MFQNYYFQILINLFIRKSIKLEQCLFSCPYILSKLKLLINYISKWRKEYADDFCKNPTEIYYKKPLRILLIRKITFWFLRANFQLKSRGFFPW